MTEAAQISTKSDNRDAGDWTLRPWLLAGGLSLVGLAIHFLIDDGGDNVPWQMGLLAFLLFGGAALAFTIREGWFKAPALFATIVGAIMGGLAWRAAQYNEALPDEEFSLAAGFLATALAVPLFQAGFHRLRMATDYSDTHYHAWTDAISAAGALAFTGLSWLVVTLLGGLFELIEIDLLKDLLNQDWFGWMFSGATFGAGLGVLRNQSQILGTLQSVVMLVFSILAVPLAIALTLFLLAVVISGPEVLWRATDSATPFLLAFAAGSLLLVNAVVRDNDVDASNSRLLRIAGAVLAAIILPLSVLAAVSMGTRIAQHGLSPERIWALIAITLACFYGVGYLASLIRGRRIGWRAQLRRSNMIMAVVTCGVALLLALPILDFGAMSTRDQLARLENGDVSAEEFDFDALRWDFGESGREALIGLTNSATPDISKLAKEANEKESRPPRYGRLSPETRAERLGNIRLKEEDPEVRKAFEAYVMQEPYLCEKTCLIIETGQSPKGNRRFMLANDSWARPLELNADGKFTSEFEVAREVNAADFTDESTIEIRPYSGQQVYVDGKPVGAPFK